MKHSVILPVYNERDNVGVVYERVKKVLQGLKEEYEIVFVNDGSTDETPYLLAKISQKDKNVKVINFSRNFGHQSAVAAGLSFSNGDIVAILDADLQDPPEVLPKFINRLNDGFDIVYAVRKNRKENLFKKAAYGFFYRLLKTVANINIPLDSGDFCVLSRRAVNAINSLPERNRFIRGIRSWVGFAQTGLEYERQARYAGKSKYTLRKLMKLAFDGIFSFSYMPLQAMFYLGIFALFLSLLGSLTAVYFRFFTPYYNRVPGFATTIILVMFIGGLQLFSIGVVGEYLRRVYDEIKQRPQYIVESTLGFEKM